jgi:hypothetical protein
MDTDLDSDRFDALRHERTEQYLGGTFSDRRHAPVELVVDPLAAETFAGQVLAILTTNLALRLFRNTGVRLAADASLHPRLRLEGVASLSERIAIEARAADPFSDPFSGRDQGGLVIHLGRRISDAPKPHLVVGSNAWLAMASRSGQGIEVDRGASLVGAAFAACIAVAETLKTVLDFDPGLRVEEARVSLWDFSTGPDARQGPDLVFPDLGRVLLVGAGAVASNLAYLLRATDVRGEIDVVDHDTVQWLNLDRSALFGVPDVGRNKAEVVAERLRERLPARAHPHTYDEYVRRSAGSRPDLVLPLANEFGVRWAIANSIPPLSIYGTTRGDWGANLGRHIPIVEPCLGCRFGESEEEPTFLCASGSLEERPTSEVGNDAALPFLSMGAAVTALSELQKLGHPGYPINPPFADLDFKGPWTYVAHHRGAFRRPCACSTVTRELFRKFNGATRFVRHSFVGD